MPGAGEHPEWFGLKRQWMARHNADGTVATGTESATSASVDIVKRRYSFYALSLLIIVPGVIFLLMGGLKPSIEFKGGTQVEVAFQQVETQDQVRAALKRGSTPAMNKLGDNLVQMANGGKLAIVSISPNGANDYRYVASDDNTIKHAGDAGDPIPALDNHGRSIHTYRPFPGAGRHFARTGLQCHPGGPRRIDTDRHLSDDRVCVRRRHASSAHAADNCRVRWLSAPSPVSHSSALMGSWPDWASRPSWR